MSLPETKQFAINGSYDPFVNAFRRTLIDLLPVKAFDEVKVIMNTTQVYPVDYIIQRFNLLPLKQEGSPDSINIGETLNVIIQNESDKDYKDITIADIAKDNIEFKLSWFEKDIHELLVLTMPPRSSVVVELKCTEAKQGISNGAIHKGLHAWYKCLDSSEFSKFAKQYEKIDTTAAKTQKKLPQLKIINIPSQFTKGKMTDCKQCNYIFYTQSIYKWANDANTFDRAREILLRNIEEIKNDIETYELDNSSVFTMTVENIDHGVMNVVRMSVYLFMASILGEFGPQDFVISYDQPHKLESKMTLFFTFNKVHKSVLTKLLDLPDDTSDSEVSRHFIIYTLNLLLKVN